MWSIIMDWQGHLVGGGADAACDEDNNDDDDDNDGSVTQTAASLVSFF